MKRFLPAAWLALILSVCALTSCGALAPLLLAPQDPSRLEQRYEDLGQKLDLASDVLKSLGPLAESLGPKVNERYEKLVVDSGKIKGYIEEGLAVASLHQRSMEQSRDPDSGQVDWMKYALLILLGGGGLYTQRRKSVEEKEQLHARVDDKSKKVKALQSDMLAIRHEIEVQRALRQAPPAQGAN